MTAMQIVLTPERFDEGPALERVAFGKLEITAAGQLLTAAIRVDNDGRHYDSGPYISGYHLAEWLAWNWWRLRWEPRVPYRKPSIDWDMAHCLPAAGEGYRWPAITIWSDGLRCSLTSAASDRSDTPFFYYLGALEGRPLTVPAMDFETAVDQFVAVVLQRLRDENFADTNLQTTWHDLCLERGDPEIGRFRRIEALMGFDPDEVAEERITELLKDGQALGENALDELATGAAGNMLSAGQITDATASVGFDMNTGDALRLDCPLETQWGRTAAWGIGVAAANAVREQAGLSDRPVTDSRLSELAGVSGKVLKSDQCTDSLSWVFHPTQNTPRIALRQWRKTGRRFDVARLIGDRLFSESTFTSVEPLSPATRSYSYRQQAQRAFAAELLSPWVIVRDMLNNDYSEENQEQVAEHFTVSPLTINTHLMNHEGYNRALYE